jgi:hypothetical protein
MPCRPATAIPHRRAAWCQTDAPGGDARPHRDERIRFGERRQVDVAGAAVPLARRGLRIDRHGRHHRAVEQFEGEARDLAVVAERELQLAFELPRVRIQEGQFDARRRERPGDLRLNADRDELDRPQLRRRRRRHHDGRHDPLHVLPGRRRRGRESGGGHQQRCDACRARRGRSGDARLSARAS